ncbi:MAG: ABC transporter permease [Spirochaetales bacterium]|jgi:ABC-2 type transport system permease protein|nr:ABC transporter permease [Spirochaetales bacterium]
MLAIYRREMTAYLVTPVGYIFIGFFLLVSGFFVSSQNFLTGSPAYTDVLANLTFMFLLVVPILTMRLFSEEKKQKTFVLLVTSPLRPAAIVIGKYLAAESVFLITLFATCIYPILMSFHGSLAGWEILGSYVGFFLLGSCFISVGLCISSLTENQVSAAVATFAVLLLLWLAGTIQQGLPISEGSGLLFALIIATAAGAYAYYIQHTLLAGVLTALTGYVVIVVIFIVDRTIFEGLVVRVFQWFSLLDRFEQFNLGVLDLRPIVFYLTFSSLFLFITVRIIEERR